MSASRVPGNNLRILRSFLAAYHITTSAAMPKSSLNWPKVESLVDPMLHSLPILNGNSSRRGAGMMYQTFGPMQKK